MVPAVANVAIDSSVSRSFISGGVAGGCECYRSFDLCCVELCWSSCPCCTTVQSCWMDCVHASYSCKVSTGTKYSTVDQFSAHLSKSCNLRACALNLRAYFLSKFRFLRWVCTNLYSKNGTNSTSTLVPAYIPFLLYNAKVRTKI